MNKSAARNQHRTFPRIGSLIRASVPDISSPIRPDRALRNSALSLPVRSPLKPIPVVPDGQQPPDVFFPVVKPAPMPQCSTCPRSQHPARAPGDNGGRALPIAPRILLGSTLDTPFLDSSTLYLY